MTTSPKDGKIEAERAAPTMVIVGCGTFGALVAEELARTRWKVTLADKNPKPLATMGNQVDRVVVVDVTDAAACAELCKDAAVVLVSFTEPRETSLLVTACMKEAGARRLVALAANPLHAEVLTRLGVDQVIFPERDQAAAFAAELERSQ